MTVAVDRRVHVLRHCLLADGGQLPPLDAPDYVPGGIDSAGRYLRSRGGFVLGGAAAGAIAGAVAPIGAALGAGAGSAAGLVVGCLRRRHPTDPANSSVAVPDVAADEQLRVMEYNVHGGMGGPDQFFATPRRLDHLAATIGRERPDLVLLQELDHFATRSNYIDTLGQLATRLHPTGAVMTPAIEKVNGRREGTGILTFNGAVITDARGLRIGDALGDDAARRLRATTDAWARVVTATLGGRQWLPFGGVVEYQPRVGTDTMVRTAAGNHIRVLSGHFSPPQHGIDEPRRQVDPIVATVGTWSGPTIFAADFNVRDGSPAFHREHEIFAATGMHEATAGAPASSDRVYVSAHFAASNPRKITTPPGEAPASDHMPVVVDVALHQIPGPAPVAIGPEIS